jgi:hypothetical protein
MPDRYEYRVDYRSAKGWEIACDTPDLSEAQREFAAIIRDGMDARLTAVDASRPQAPADGSSVVDAY